MLKGPSQLDERVPMEVGTIQVNFCKNPHCQNFGIPASTKRQLHEDYVFTYRGQPFIQGFRKSLKTACKNADIPFGRKVPGGFTFHDIRSTVKTNMLRAGVDKALRDTILGHSLKGMAAYYLKPTDEDLTNAMDKYTEWLDEQLAEVSASVAQTVAQDEKPKTVKAGNS